MPKLCLGTQSWKLCFKIQTSITHQNAAGTVTLDSFTYTYDNADNVKTETSTLGPTKNYTYDATNQLTGDGTTTYAWDANGNNTAFTTGTNNQLSTDGTWNYTYDADGNETTKTIPSTGEIWTYTYDVDNRLVKAEHKLTSTSAVDVRDQFSYDVLGNRISKTLGVGPTTTTKFAYDANGNAWVDYTGTGTVIARHVFGMSTDSLIANITAGSTTWYLKDILGSTRDLTNAAGTLTDHLDYNSFGKLTHESNPGTADRYQWTGREVDVELGLQYNRARYYDASTQRWLSQDPMGFDAGDSNLYRYVNNAPTGATDPSGLNERPNIGRPPEKGDPNRDFIPGLSPPDPSRIPPVLPEAKESPYEAFERYSKKLDASLKAERAAAKQLETLQRYPLIAPPDAWQLGMTDQWREYNRENYKAGKFLMGWNPVGRFVLVPLEIAEGNYKTAAFGGLLIIAGPAFRLARGAPASSNGMASNGMGMGQNAGQFAARVTTNTGTNVVYRSVNAAGEVQYVGITNNFARRAAEHLRSRGRASAHFG